MGRADLTPPVRRDLEADPGSPARGTWAPAMMHHRIHKTLAVPSPPSGTV